MTEERTRGLEKETVFIVDWDLPVGPMRFGFYRALKRLRRDLGLHGRMSTMSVLITKDQDLATAVYHLARRFSTRVHLYRGREVEPVEL